MTGVILFRAQPFHNGHLDIIKQAVEDCLKQNSRLYIFVGSADKSETVRNPLPINLRLKLIEGSLNEEFPNDIRKIIHIVPLEDLTDESDNSHNWGRYLLIKMMNCTRDFHMTIYYSDDPSIMLSWFDKDDIWGICFNFVKRYQSISATLVRKTISENNTDTLKTLVPNFVFNHLPEIQQYIQ